MCEKKIIGMIHLKPMITSPSNEHSIDEIIEFALNDLKILENAGFKYVLVENVFDRPYNTRLSLELIIAYTHIFTVLKNNTTIDLGVNLHATSGTEEMIVSSLCGAEFIRAESFVEYRVTMSGILEPMAAKLMRKRKELDSNVKIYADVNVKESIAMYEQNIEKSISDAVEAEADAIIVTGLATGKPPKSKEIKALKKYTDNKPLLIGSGVNEDNFTELMRYADGAIIGSSIKEEGIINNPVSLKRAKKIMEMM